MTTALLATKFFAPQLPVPGLARPQLMQLLEQGLAGRVTLVCAAAGFGKSTLVNHWLQECAYPSAWLSLDPQDADPTRFLAYVLGALQRVAPELGAGLADLLQGSHPASAETVLTRLVNQLAGMPGKLLLVLDDWHLAASAPVQSALAFLLENLPEQLHLVLLSREEPALPLARLRLQGLLHEVGPQQLRFGLEEAADFFKQGLPLALSPVQVQALETRTEGWVAGLKLAVLSLQGQSDADAFVDSFTGSHRFVQDYLLEEVLLCQPAEVQAFLLQTSVLERLCGPLCDAVLQGQGGQAMLERLEQAHLFIVPLDAHKRWYRYHHLFAELLRQRLLQAEPADALHQRASQWFEDQGLEAEAFEQATAAHDIARAMRLIAGPGMPLYLRGEAAPVLRWLATQSDAVRNAHPGLWLMQAWCLLITGQHSQIQAKLDGAEAALETHRDQPDSFAAAAPASPAAMDMPALQGQLAVLRAWQSVAQNQVESIRSNAQRALELLPAGSTAERTAAQCALGVAHLFGGNRDAARLAFAAVVEASRSSGNLMFTVVASIALAGLQAGDFLLHQAAASYREVLALIRNPEDSVGYEAHLGLARILYEWNALEAASTHAQHSSQLSARAESESGLGAEVLRARLLIHQGAHSEADVLLARIGEAARTKRFKGRMQEAAELQVLHWLQQGRAGEAHALASAHALPLGQARALLAQGQGREALGVATRYRQAMEAKGLAHETLKALVVQTLIHQGLGERSRALQVLQQALQQAAQQGALRLFADEGPPLHDLLSSLQSPPGLQPYVAAVLQAFGEAAVSTSAPVTASLQGPLDAFSERELEVLRLIQQGHSNQKISEQLFVSLSTVKWHNQNIFSKLDVQRRTQAVARALELKLL